MSPLILLTLVVAVTADSGCVQNARISTALFNALMTELKGESNGITRQDKLENFLQSKEDTGGLGFNGNQTAQILDLWDNSISQSEIIEAMGPFLLGITCEEVAAVMETTFSSFTRMDMLKALVRHLSDGKAGGQLTKNAQFILNEFTISFDKDDAKELILNSKPFSCVFGPINAVGRFDFVVDTSGSMGTTFNHNGVTVSRLSFIQSQLKLALQSLQNDQQFNIVRFSSSASEWKPGVQQATASNIQLASTWAEGLVASGSTCMKCGLQMAFNDPQVQGIYLLTDGAPNSGSTAVSSFAYAWASKTDPPKPIFCIGFQAGAAGGWMQNLANMTGAVYRDVY